MYRKILSLALLSLLTIAGFADLVPIASAHNAQFPLTYDPFALVIDTIADTESLDPAWAYDTASVEVIGNVYETLITFDRVYTDGPYNAGKTNQFVPLLATALPTIEYFIPPITSPQGLLIYSRWSFPIRTGVQFHDGAILTPADVEYSFERALVQDRAGGPIWTLYEPLLNVYAAQSPTENPDWGLIIDYAIQNNATHVWFNLATEYPEMAFKQILSQPWSSVVEMAWAVAEGDLDIGSVPGLWSNWQQISDSWNNPAVSFLEDAIGRPSLKDGGTGPYEYDYWTVDVARSIVKNDGGAADPLGRAPDPHADPTPATTYWDGWPARVRRGGSTRIGGFVERVTWNDVEPWPSRLADFLAGYSDMTAVPRNYRDQILGQSVGGELIRCYWRQPPNEISLMGLDAFFFTLNIAPTSPYLGPGFDPSTPYQFGADRIPINLFSDVNVRGGFAFAFDYADFLASAFLNEGEQPSDPAIEGLAYDNPIQAGLWYDMVLAEYYLRLAWGGVDNAPLGPPWGPEDVDGALFTNGMSFTITYNRGNVAREMAAENLATRINALNPSMFNIQVQGVNWNIYLSAMETNELPLFINGWSVHFTDPHDFVFQFQHSQGTFSYSQNYNNPVVDALVVAGIQTSDDAVAYDNSLENANGLANLDNKPAGNWQTWPTNPAYYLVNPLDQNYPRRAIYYALQFIYYEDVPSVPIAQIYMRHWEQAWVRGWYHNPLHGGSLTPGIDSAASIYAYHLWKAQTHFGDANNDGAVNILDVSTLSSSWTGPPRGPAYFLPQADITGGIGATVGPYEGPVKGMPNGRVEIDDLSTISSYWDGPPIGPSHP